MKGNIDLMIVAVGLGFISILSVIQKDYSATIAGIVMFVLFIGMIFVDNKVEHK